ncbi:glycosyltransferase family 4 protein [Massilia sp. IC2-476]|uniref:glycosyltransferase family 4 protein n=1 Tax=Massilia sp. IC2-476 TaxID=2887199 RepID=UPI001D11C902|nr:glycosyltransferase family 4 protein [Massilia sp. IC2-476]MCC2973783.1 glycosyltransferase family 4 protein [Massilia sp. IC2-476]
MKILLFTNSLAGGGAERVVATLANFWAGRHWDVTVLTLAPHSEDFYVLDSRVRRIALDRAGESRNALHGLLQNLGRVLALRRTLRQLRPDLAVAIMSTPNVLLALAACGLPWLRTVGSERCYPPHAPLGRLWQGLRRRSYGRLDAVVALTSECAAWITEHTFAHRVPVIPNPTSWPLPVRPPVLAPQAVCAPGRRLLLAVGRLEPVKNFATLVAVFARLAPRHADWDLVILGAGPERAALEAAVRAAGLEGRIALPGIAGNVGEWYARADLFVMSSHSEGFPNALAEALAHGLPAVSFDCNTGPRDIIRQGVDGLLVPAGDSEALAHALGRVMGDDGLRQALAARAGEARERFSLEKIAGMWESLFRQLSGAPVSATTRRARAHEDTHEA